MTTIPEIDQVITTIAPVLHRDSIDPTLPSTQDAFVSSAEAFFDKISTMTVSELNAMIGDINAFKSAVNTVSGEINTLASGTQSAANSAANSAAAASDSADAAADKVSEIQSIKGKGETLAAGQSVTVSYDPILNEFTFGIPQGIKGETGEGIASIAKTGTTGLVDTYTITMTDSSTSTFTVTNGLDGIDGVGVDHIAKTSGTGAAGTTDVYTVWGDIAETINLGTFNVYNGLNGTGLVNSVVAGANVTVDNTDPANPIISVSASAQIEKPIITSPTSGTIDYIGAVTSSYTTSDTYAGIQDYVKWECGNVDFSVIYDSYEGNSNLTSWTPSTGLTLTQVFVRTKQGSDGHRSIYSDAINFTTPDIYIETPTLTVTGTPANVTLTPTLTTSAFSVYNGTDTHLSTDWQVVKVSDGTVVFESLNNTTNKTSITTSQLPMNTPLIFRARHNSNTYGSSAWVEVSGTTINIYVANPTLTVTGTPSSITLSPTLTGSAFTIVNGTDTHLNTDWQVIKVSDSTVAWESLADATNKTSIQASGLEKTTEYKFRVKYNSSTYGSSDWIEITGTTLDIYTLTPTLTVAGTPTSIAKNPTLTTSAFAIYNGTDTHLSTDWQVIKNSDGTTVWESLNNTTNKLSITSGDLAVSTEYRFRARHNSTNYGSSAWVEVIGTTKAVFTPTVGVQGAKGFGVAPTDEPFALLGLAEMTGTTTEGHDNYGNYIHTNGSIVCWCPKAYYRIGNAASPRYATYSVNALDIVGTDVYTTEAAANAAGYVLPRAFINAGAEKSGFFIDKYMNSKDGTTSSKSVFGGIPISLATTAGYTVSNGMTGCTGILADAVVLSKARGSRWNTVLAFQYAYLAMVSVAQGQAATSTANCAWYDAAGTTNFPKGCNNSALSDINDITVTYLTAGDTGNANKPKTGATANFAKTTHNGSINGVADLNGGMFEVSIGITNIGTSATSTTAIATDTIYTLKTTIDHASLTGNWNTTNDVWGDATNLATKYNAVTSPHPLGSATGTVYWGNVANAVFPTDASGVNRDICGFIPKNSTASSATGINMLGNDQFYKQNINNLVPLCCGGWGSAATAGLFCRSFLTYRSYDSYYASFRASAYFA